MQIQSAGSQNFGALHLTKDAVLSSPKTYFALQKETGKLMKLADNVDIFLKKKYFRDRFSGASIDLIVKVKEARPQSNSFMGKVFNFIKKPILRSEKGYAGMNFGTFDSPLAIATELKDKLMRRAVH